MRYTRGMSLIDVVVGVSLLLILFLALFGVLRASLAVSTLAKTKAAGIALAENQMEYLRGLSYANLGTSGGIPSGSIAQQATSTVDSVAYGVRTLIEYYDDSADGTGASDTNGITADYKVAKVAVTWGFFGTPEEVDLVSNFAPPGIETLSSGGTLAINVVDASLDPVGDATVNIVNSSVSPSVNLTTYTDDAGQALLPGASPSTQYQVYVSKSGDSSAQTYAKAGQNQNPSPGYLTVSNGETTTGTFSIDTLASFALTTYASDGSTTDPDISYSLTGAKTIGSTSGGAPIYKNVINAATNGSGEDDEAHEWDDYSLAVTGHDVIDACPAPPYDISPGENLSATISLGSATANSLLVAVADDAGNPVANASVEVKKSGYDQIETTTACGNAYFGNLGASTYSATISKTGYTLTTFSNIKVSSETYYDTSFP